MYHSIFRRLVRILCIFVIPFCFFFCFPLPGFSHSSVDEYLDLPLETLLNTEITSVSKKKQHLHEVASAVFVISAEDIRRSGVTSIPEALRMAPGIQVGKIDSSRWAISSRGFAGQYSNKLLVLIDGKTVYAPSFSGVYWDVQDILLEDIDRIEVIRGPGASIWGANAVNGVINIISKSADETQGTLVSFSLGNEEKRDLNLRYGFDMGHSQQARTYFKYREADSSYHPASHSANYDGWESLRTGFRIDGHEDSMDLLPLSLSSSSQRATQRWTLQGDIYQNRNRQRLNLWLDPSQVALPPSGRYLQENVPDTIESSGGHVMAKWELALNEHSHITTQFYYDRFKRKENYLTQTYDTYDFEFQHQYRLLDNHEIIWGLGYRLIKDRFNNSFSSALIPDNDSSDLFSAFIQDEIELIPNQFYLTLGSKFEHNQYTDNEYQPSLRLLWKFENASVLWGAISRAVRTPSRMEHSGEFVNAVLAIAPQAPPVIIRGIGSDRFDAEHLIAYELGYRIQAQENLSFDLALFYNEYDDLQNFSSDPSNPFSDSYFDNRLKAQSYGLEFSANWQVNEWWKLQGNYSLLKIDAQSLAHDSHFYDTASTTQHSAPSHQVSIRSQMDIRPQLSLDLWLYYVDELKETNISQPIFIDSYRSFNARLAWQINKSWEISLVGQNLFDSRHPEFYGERLLTNTEVERSVYAQLRFNLE